MVALRQPPKCKPVLRDAGQLAQAGSEADTDTGTDAGAIEEVSDLPEPMKQASKR